jgi:four helix bundle protein
MRDHTKLRAFELADQLALATYKLTMTMPPDERFGMTSQMRRAAVSVPSNIVEGCARDSQAEYLRYLYIAFGSAKERGYQLSLAERLQFLDPDAVQPVHDLCNETCRVLNGLIRSLS